MDIYWTTAGGDELRITDVETKHPRLQFEDALTGGWRDGHPKRYPHSILALAVSLIGALSDLDMLDNPAILDCGIHTEKT